MLPVKSVLTVPDGTKWVDVENGTVVPDITYMPKQVIKTNGNAQYFPFEGEVNKEPSLTIPNAAMTVRELLIRFAAGMPVTAGKVPLYEGDHDEPDIDKMDHVELHNYYKELSERRSEATDRVKKARAKAEEIKMEKIVAERVEKAKYEKDLKEFEEFKKNKGGING